MFANAQTYNSESVAAGDLLIGDNSSSEANFFFDKSAGRIYIRGGKTAEAYIDTDGSFTAGDGDVTLNSDGMKVTLPASIDRQSASAIKFLIGSTLVSSLTGRGSVGAGAVSEIELNADFPTGTSNDTAVVSVKAGDVDAPDYSGITVVAKQANSAGHYLDLIIDDTAIVSLTEGAISNNKRVIQDGDVLFKEQSSTPAVGTQDEDANVYVKGSKLVVQYDDGGTVRYKYLDLTGTGVTWTHTTTAP